MSPPSAEELAVLRPEGLRAYVVRCVRRTCWEFMSFDGCSLEGDDRGATFVAIVHGLEAALVASDDEMETACLRAGTFGSALRTEQFYERMSPSGCYAAVLEHTRGGLRNLGDVRQIQNALLSLAEHARDNPTKFDSRPSLASRVKAMRRDYAIAVKLREKTHTPKTIFGDLWTDAEFPEYADYDESWW